MSTLQIVLVCAAILVVVGGFFYVNAKGGKPGKGRSGTPNDHRNTNSGGSDDISI